MSQENNTALPNSINSNGQAYQGRFESEEKERFDAPGKRGEEVKVIQCLEPMGRKTGGGGKGKKVEFSSSTVIAPAAV